MYLFDVLRSFLPLQNPIGFGAADLVEFAWATLLVALALLWRPWIEPFGRRLAVRTGWCMLLLAVLPVALRLALLPHHPAPSPDLYDEFGHLLVADTLRHFRLANPAHPMHRFFETFFVLQEPTYSSIYPLGAGAMLAFGGLLFGHPWAGVILAAAALCSLCYWMLRAWTTPAWALAGGLLAVMEFGPLSYWMNTYWGGALPAAAGCLVFGSLPRLAASGAPRDAAILGAGLAVHWMVRPYESIFVFLGAGLYFLPALLRPGERLRLARAAAVVALVLAPAAAITLLHNRQVTGSWTTLPEMLSQRQYGVPSSLTFQPNPVPSRQLTPEQQLDYEMQVGFRGPTTDTPARWLDRLQYRVRFYRFFYLVPLYLALPLFFAALREYRFAWVALTLALFAAGINFFPAYQHHYLAAVTCLFVLASVTALDRLCRIRALAGADAARLILFLCMAHFAFWYGLHLFDGHPASQTIRTLETWNTINHTNPERRILVNRELARLPGRQLVFVRYHYPRHVFQDEWVYNEADIDTARVVWARDLGPEEDEQLRRYYPDRKAWLLEPDLRPPRLAPYEPPPPVEKPPSTRGTNPFLPIPEARE